jgi:membrane protease YdiL (CAAX protease family)
MNEIAPTNEQPDTNPEETPARPFPGFIASCIWIIAFFGLQIIGAVIAVFAVVVAKMVSGANPGELSAQPPLEMIGGIPLIWSLVGSSSLTLFLLWLYLRKNDRMGSIGLSQWSKLGLKTTIFMAVLLCGAVMGFNYLYETYAIPGVELQTDLRMLFDSIPVTFANRTLLFLTIAILAPTVEELLFRGLLQNSLVPKMPIAAAIGISSAVFAAMHLDLYAFPALFAMGAVFGYIYYRTGSLRVNILLHMINNGTALVLDWAL